MQVEDLRVALMEAGRNDLAEELATRNKEYRQQIDERLEGRLYKKLFLRFLIKASIVYFREPLCECEYVGPVPIDNQPRIS